MPGKDKGRGKGKTRGKAPDKITVSKVHFYPIRTGSQQNGPKSVIIGNTYYRCLRGGYPEWLRANRSTEMVAEAATARGVQKIQDGELSDKSLSQGEDISGAPDRIIEYIRRDDAIMVSEIPEDEIDQSIRVNTHHPDVRCPPRVHDCTTCNERSACKRPHEATPMSQIQIRTQQPAPTASLETRRYLTPPNLRTRTLQYLGTTVWSGC
ncbi:hypothetical protein BGX38DRAFT_178559 [Terfezia claveryi]|nr:hypothetical protein BGX38DRAFT_178559 [Terfezia claveryi]